MLTRSLESESKRWDSELERLGRRISRLTGDCIMAAACVNYLGPLPGSRRTELVAAWQDRLRELGIAVHKDWRLDKALASALQRREWALHHLPAGTDSIANAVMVRHSLRWPLLVDPQGQGAKWIRSSEAIHGLRALRISDPLMLKVVEAAVPSGTPVLLEGVDSSEAALEPGLDALLTHSVHKSPSRLTVRIGESDVEVSPGFRLYMCCSQAAPHFLPEVTIRVNVINFAVDSFGLMEQLLAAVVRCARPA